MARRSAGAEFRSRAKRFAEGRELRRSTPREDHAELRGADRRSALDILRETDAGRVKAVLPLRYHRMEKSPFAFLRGAASVMASDLAAQPNTGLLVQACGDAHLLNFAAFVSPENNIAFDMNDFDETLEGVDFTVDLKRLASSVAVAALTAGDSPREARRAAADMVRAYRRRMIAFSAMSPAEIWGSRIDLKHEVSSFTSRILRRKLGAIIRLAKQEGLAKDGNFPRLIKKRRQIADNWPKIFHFGRLSKNDRPPDPTRLFNVYRDTLPSDRAVLLNRYKLCDVAFKAVGVGSVGTFCCIALFLSADDEPLFLQVKQAQRSVLERLDRQVAYKSNQGQRVVEGQRKIQAASDVFLGFTHDATSRRDFYVRTLKNQRLSGISEIAELEALSEYSILCGKTLARAHARSGDAAALAGYMGRSDAFDRAIASFAMAYADRTIADHEELVRAGKGRKLAA